MHRNLGLLGWSLPVLLSALLWRCGEVTVTPEIEAIPEVISTSIAEGERVAVETASITIRYSMPIILSETGADLNGTECTSKTQNVNLTLSWEGPLEYGTDYTLTLPEGVVVSRNTNTSAEPFVLHFQTEIYVEVLENPTLPDEMVFDLTEDPVNPNATAETRNLYHYLRDNFQQGMLSSAMTDVNWDPSTAQWVYDKTGKWPAILCFDFIHYTRKGTDYDYWVDYEAIVENGIQYWNDGGILALMWHWLDPLRDTDAFYCGNASDEVTTFDASKVFDTSSAEYAAIIADIDEIATHLKRLQEAGVPVLWRPMHEAEGSYRWGAWFWWGNAGADPCKEIWRVMYDRLVNHHGLNNLLWVWTVSLDNFDYLWYNDAMTWYPGDEMVDIVGIDIYDDAVQHGSQLEMFKKTALVGGCKKITALTECGYIPDPVLFETTEEKWSYFMTWYRDYTMDDRYNGADFWRRLMDSDVVISRDELPEFK